MAKTLIYHLFVIQSHLYSWMNKYYILKRKIYKKMKNEKSPPFLQDFTCTRTEYLRENP